MGVDNIKNCMVMCKDCKNAIKPWWPFNELEWEWKCKASPRDFSCVTGKRESGEYRSCDRINDDGKCRLFEAK